MSLVNLDKTLSAMDDILNLPLPTIDERSFVKDWLPLFAAHATPENPVYIERWSDVSKSPFNKVNVMRGDVVVCTVPPLLDSNTATIRAAPGAFAAVINHTQQLHQSQPEQADNFFMSKVAEAIGQPVINMGHVAAWDQIFQMYGVKDNPYRTLLTKLTHAQPIQGDIGDGGFIDL